MIIGVNLPNYSSLGHRDSVVAIAQTAEALGYASPWTNDHVLLPTSRPEPFGNVLESLTTLSYLAASTNHIRLGPGFWYSLSAILCLLRSRLRRSVT